MKIGRPSTHPVCTWCGGSGKVPVPKYDRKKKIRYTKMEKCNNCYGKGRIKPGRGGR